MYVMFHYINVSLPDGNMGSKLIFLGFKKRFMKFTDTCIGSFTKNVSHNFQDIPQVPNFISSEIHNVVFKLLYHSQLTIREHAAKALSTYISCSDVQVYSNNLINSHHSVLLMY